MKRRSAQKVDDSKVGILNKHERLRDESHAMFEPDVVLEETAGARSTKVRKLTAEEKKAQIRQQTAERVRRYRERQKLLKAQQKMKATQVHEAIEEELNEEEKQLKTLHSITMEPEINEIVYIEDPDVSEKYYEEPEEVSESCIEEPEISEIYLEEPVISEITFEEPEISEVSYEIKEEDVSNGYVYRPRKKDTSHDEKLAELRRKAAERVRRYRDRKKLQQSLKSNTHKKSMNATSKNKTTSVGQKVLMYQIPRMKLPASAKKHSQYIPKDQNSVTRMRKQAAIRNHRYRERKRNLKNYADFYVQYTESHQFTRDFKTVMSVLPSDLHKKKILLQKLLEDVSSKISNTENENETENIEASNSTEMNPLFYLQLQPNPTESFENYEYLDDPETF